MGEGLPEYKNPFEKGRLIIQFNVIFPTALPTELISTLEQCLPPRPAVDIPINAEECTLSDYDPTKDQRRRRQVRLIIFRKRFASIFSFNFNILGL
jgi:DnaJ family protein A protein 1